MCIAVPDTCILAESNRLIKYSSPSNSQRSQLMICGQVYCVKTVDVFIIFMLMNVKLVFSH